MYREVLAKQLAALPGPFPRSVPCPKCGAGIGYGCKAASGYHARTHIARWKARGVSKPDPDDRMRDYLHGQILMLDMIEAHYRSPKWLARKEERSGPIKTG